MLTYSFIIATQYYNFSTAYTKDQFAIAKLEEKTKELIEYLRKEINVQICRDCHFFPRLFWKYVLILYFFSSEDLN